MAEVGARSVALLRILVGAAALLRSTVAWGQLDAYEPEILRIPVVSWWPDPASSVVAAAVVTWALAAVAFTIGWRVAVSGPLLSASITVFLLSDFQTYSNHLYLMVLLVLLTAVADGGASLAIGGEERSVPLWPIVLIKVQISLIYFFTAISKLTDDFLSGRILAGTTYGGVLSFPEGLRTPSVLGIAAIAAVVIEFYVALFLWRRALRPAGIVLGVGLHSAIALFIGPPLELLVFSILMVASYPLFLDRAPLVVVWDDDCASCAAWIRRFQRFDLLRLLEPVGKSDGSHSLMAGDVERAMHSISPHAVQSGFAAVTDILERLVPSLWLAPLLRLPGVSQAGERWYRRQAQRRGCPVS